jgi:hypothetical protein
MKAKTRQLLNRSINYGIDFAFRKFQRTNGELVAMCNVGDLKEAIEHEIWEFIDREFDFEDEA